MNLVTLSASLPNTLILFHLDGNPHKFDVLKLLGFQRRVVFQLSSTARAVGKSKLLKGVDLIIRERNPLVSGVTRLATFLAFLPRLFGCLRFTLV